ncbi:LytR C-terminal domain-containing protein [Mycobacterium sp. SM1]|uniref:LytR C-terminal domain-containing protein n=1 Tax=Mycobacterium sp. SM1 TaxID=2816243 RepID=UPI001BCC9768|nr:LytR C-terminal domain-containing protein [Mycobacterium sp. SM1]MBS4728465.1 LytR C-terminal domain-containing protein [Mycobacterium sp. SM1]
MSERVPDSSGLPLRAMVMVLLFLGVIFLLLGWQAMSSSGSADDDSSRASAVTATSTRPSPTTTPAARQAVVRVYNISRQDGVAGRTANELKAAGFDVTEIGDLSLPDVSVTTVYFTNADGERATAEAVGQKLGAAVEPRIPEVADQPPGVIVVVAR